MTVAINNVPDSTVANLSKPARVTGDLSRRDMRATWSVPSGLTNSNNARRTESLGVRFALYPDGDTSEKRRIDYYRTYGTGTTSATLNIASFTSNNGANEGMAVTRDSFYPRTNVKLGGLGVVVRCFNSKGMAPNNTWQQAWFRPPRKPAISAPAVDTSEWRVSATISTNAGDDMQERYDTRYQVIVYDSRTKRTQVAMDASTTATSVAAGYDIGNVGTLTESDYITVTFRAWARGYAGDSDVVEKSHTVAFPALATISKCTCAGRAAGNRATISLKTNSSAQHPVDRVVLQVLADVDADTADAAATTSGWSEPGFQDNSNCTGMSVLMDGYLPSRGKHTWLRVKTWHDHEQTLRRFSKAVEVPNVYLPPATEEASTFPVHVTGVEPGGDGTSALVTLAWDNTGATGVELSWSDDPDAWISTQPPSTYVTTRDEGATGGHAHGCQVLVRGLSEGVAYYFKARRYVEEAGGTAWYAYSSASATTPTVAPTSVVLAAPAYTVDGEPLALSWAFSSSSQQRGWQLVDASTGAVAAHGTDATGAVTLPWERVSALAVDGVLSLLVRVSTGGAYVASDAVAVSIATAPALAIGTLPDLTAQPLSIPLTCGAEGATVAIAVLAEGATGSTPAGARSQTSGDAVWADVVAPEWANGAATVTLPSGLDFWDGCAYTVQARATDPVTGLSSARDSASFTVAWAHQAPPPSDSITVAATVDTDADGIVSRRAVITLAAPEGAAAGDVYDVYRVSADGAELVCAGAAGDAVVTDPYAPYGAGGLAYRIATRTADGDVDWLDYPYEMDGDVLRIDFAGDVPYVELPWNIAIQQTFSKDFEQRAHLDGSTAGYWNAAVGRSATFGCSVARDESATLAALRALKARTGACMVRTPDGEAYEADVEVNGLDSDGGPVVGVTLSVAGISPTGAFAATAETNGEG